MNDKSSETGKRIADELAACGVRLVASLPDNWLTGVIDALWHLGVRDITLPIRSETVWRALCDARTRRVGEGQASHERQAV